MWDVNWEKGGAVGRNNHLSHTWRQFKSQKPHCYPVAMFWLSLSEKRVVLCPAYYPSESYSPLAKLSFTSIGQARDFCQIWLLHILEKRQCACVLSGSLAMRPQEAGRAAGDFTGDSCFSLLSLFPPSVSAHFSLLWSFDLSFYVTKLMFVPIPL